MAMDMDMNDSMDAADYSDYKHQQIEAVIRFRGTGNQSVKGVNSIEPLDGAGRLEQNEVAELVAYDLHAAIEIEGESGDQDVGTQVEHRGYLGFNLPTSDSGAFVTTADPDPEGDVEFIDNNNGNSTGGFVSEVDDRKLQHFRAYIQPAFDDEASGPGGAGGLAPFNRHVNCREKYGRGPVLDSTDDITISHGLNAGDSVQDTFGAVRLGLVWDIAEVSDAGRAFSVPR